MIKELTKKQEAAMPAFRDKYIAKGLSIATIDHQMAIATINKCYKLGGLKNPDKIEFVPSPLAMINRGAELMGNPNDKKLKQELKRNSCYGQHEAGWLSFYSFFRTKVGLKKETDISEGLIESVDTLHWWLPFDEACIASERPITQKIENGVLHSENGPAIEYADGFSVFSMWGVAVPAWIATTPKEKLDLSKVMALTAVDQRTVALRKIGLHNLKDQLKVEIIHTFEDYELWSIEIEKRRVGPYLKMVGPTTGEIHVEGVGSIPGELDLKIDTCQKALISRIQNSELKEYKKPLFKA